MNNLFRHLLQRSFASDCVDFEKMKSLVPREVEGPHTKYRAKVVEIVFDPMRIEEVNAKYRSDGYIFDEDLKVIAVTEDEEILLWGGINSVYHLKRGEQITGAFDSKYLGFEDLLDFIKPFGTKRKKVEIDEMLERLKKRYGAKDDHSA